MESMRGEEIEGNRKNRLHRTKRQSVKIPRGPALINKRRCLEKFRKNEALMVAHALGSIVISRRCEHLVRKKLVARKRSILAWQEGVLQGESMKRRYPLQRKSPVNGRSERRDISPEVRCRGGLRT